MTDRIDRAVHAALASAQAGAPPTLAAALAHAVLSGGARVRPRLCVAVAEACGDDDPVLADVAACSLEFVHCGSLAHDDLPCFDDALTRRGQPSVHAAYGQAIAVLVGDGLIVQAFDVLSRVGVDHDPRRIVTLVRLLAAASGTREGIVAGQAWESEPSPPLERYHHAKTASMFRAATMMGAVAAGADPAPWRVVGDAVGEAYQLADDLLDAIGDPTQAGKPVGRDAALDRPSAVTTLGAHEALARFDRRVEDAITAVPDVPGRAAVAALVQAIAQRLLPAAARGALRAA
jgi:geranylgeranyl diphosphate synthase type II